MIDTLTAYKCSFRFLQRNNPLIGEQRNAIKDDKKTDYSFLEFLNDYTEYTKDIAVGESSHRAISLSQDNIDYSVGIVLNKKVSDFVLKGDVLGFVYANNMDKLEVAKRELESIIKISDKKIEKLPVIFEIIDK